MSEKIVVKSVGEYYHNAFDIVRFMRNNCDDFMEFVVKDTEDFFARKNYSPIVEQAKRKSYMIDYFFLAASLAKYIKEYVIKNYDEDEEVAEILRNRIRNDFGQEGEMIKNGKFLIGVLNFFGYIIPSSNYKFMYLQICYERKDSDLTFVQNGLLINGKGIERFKNKLKKFCEKSLYKELTKGPRGVAKITREKMKERKFIEDFSF